MAPAYGAGVLDRERRLRRGRREVGRVRAATGRQLDAGRRAARRERHGEPSPACTHGAVLHAPARRVGAARRRRGHGACDEASGEAGRAVPRGSLRSWRQLAHLLRQGHRRPRTLPLGGRSRRYAARVRPDLVHRRRLRTRGHVETGPRDFKSLSAADPSHALATDDAGRLWQTVDGGAHWIQVATPPGRWDRSEARGRGANAMRCSLVGCVLSATGGSWLRTGWPEDPPSLGEDAGVAAPAASRAASDGGGDRPTPPPEVVTAAPAIPPPPVLPRLRCALRAECARSSLTRRGPSREGEESKALFGGRLLLERTRRPGLREPCLSRSVHGGR